MICSEVDSLITEYLEDAMSQSARADFEAHLEACRECQSRLDETRALIDVSHKLGEKLRQDWSERTAGETAEHYFQRLEGKLLRESRPARRPYRRLAPTGAAVAIVAIAAGVWVYVHRGRTSAVPLNLTVNLTQEGPLRGAQQPKETPVEFPRRILNLMILMPIGSEPGHYDVAVWRDGKTLVQVHAPGTLKDGITTVRVQMDCRGLPRGSYKLLTRFDHWSWQDFPILIR
jgi:Putative zinc-finger